MSGSSVGHGGLQNQRCSLVFTLRSPLGGWFNFMLDQGRNGQESRVSINTWQEASTGKECPARTGRQREGGLDTDTVV